MGGYLFTIYYAHNYASIGKSFDYVVLFLLFISVSISFSCNSYTFTKKRIPILDFIARYSIYPYLIYKVSETCLPILVTDKATAMTLYYVITFSLSFILCLFEKQIINQIKKLKRIFIIQN